MLLCLPQKFPQGRQSFKPVQNAECVNNNLETIIHRIQFGSFMFESSLPFWLLDFVDK